MEKACWAAVRSIRTTQLENVLAGCLFLFVWNLPIFKWKIYIFDLKERDLVWLYNIVYKLESSF